METEGFSLPVVEAYCAYRQPARYDDELEIQTKGSIMTPVRIRFDYAIVRGGEDTVLADGHTIHASLDAEGRPRRLPQRVSEVLERCAP